MERLVKHTSVTAYLAEDSRHPPLALHFRRDGSGGSINGCCDSGERLPDVSTVPAQHLTWDSSHKAHSLI